MTLRHLVAGERLIIDELLSRSTPGKWQATDLSIVLVEDMEDGDMGSLRFGPSKVGRRYSRTVAESWFLDSDQVPVVVGLNLDQDDELFELDSWKVDFSPRRSLPTSADSLQDGPARMPQDSAGADRSHDSSLGGSPSGPRDTSTPEVW